LLEDRLTPAIHTWTGLGANDNWTTPANWQGNLAPNPADGADDLVFPNGAARLTNVNNFAAGTTFRSINFESNGYTIAGNRIQLQNGIRATPAAGENTFRPNISLVGEQTFEVDGTALLHLTGILRGTSNLTKDGDGELSLEGTGTNSYRGTTTVASGILHLEKAGGNALSGNVRITSGVVELHANNQIVDTSRVRVEGLGLLDLNGFSDTIGGLTLVGGTVTTGAGVLGLQGNLTSLSATTPGNISGNLDLGGVRRTVTVGSGGLAADLTIAAAIHNGGLAKKGAGILALEGANDYSGTTQVQEGVLRIRNSSALGTTAGGTVVRNRAALQVEGNLSVPEKLQLGTLQQPGGTVRNTGGANVWTGAIVVNKPSAIQTDVATGLTLNGLVNVTGRRLLFDSTGDTTVNGEIQGTRQGRIIKESPGMLVLGGLNTYEGRTSVFGGTLLVNGSIGSRRPLDVATIATLSGGGNIASPVFINSGVLSPGPGPAVLSLGGVTFSIASTFVVELNGFVAGTGYDQLDVLGRVELGNSILALSGNPGTSVGATFTIIDNDGTDPVVGTFLGLPEGATFTVNGHNYRINYAAGINNNDVVLTQLS
jgi:autotransporter-associated beta strand protein